MADPTQRLQTAIDLVKGGHKYVRRVKSGGKWHYLYDDTKKVGATGGRDVHGPGHKDLFSNREHNGDKRTEAGRVFGDPGKVFSWSQKNHTEAARAHGETAQQFPAGSKRREYHGHMALAHGRKAKQHQYEADMRKMPDGTKVHRQHEDAAWDAYRAAAKVAPAAVAEQAEHENNHAQGQAHDKGYRSGWHGVMHGMGLLDDKEAFGPPGSDHETKKSEAEARLQGAIDMLKGGEGSRGGNVIGHTSSGKPIYDHHAHEGHKGFTHNDHMDAVKLHSDKQDALHGKRGRATERKKDHHYEQQANHYRAAQKAPKHEGTPGGHKKSDQTEPDLVKGGHKYASRKRVGNRYVYTYADSHYQPQKLRAGAQGAVDSDLVTERATQPWANRHAGWTAADHEHASDVHDEAREAAKKRGDKIGAKHHKLMAAAHDHAGDRKVGNQGALDPATIAAMSPIHQQYHAMRAKDRDTQYWAAEPRDRLKHLHMKKYHMAMGAGKVDDAQHHLRNATNSTVKSEYNMIDLSEGDALSKAQAMNDGDCGVLGDATLVIKSEGRFTPIAFEEFATDPNSDIVKAGGGPFIGKRGGKWADPQHKIPWDDKKHAGKPSPKAKDHDEHGAHELQLHIENTYGHQNQHESIRDNLSRKMAAGKYDHAQATKLFRYLADSGSKQYKKEHGSSHGGSHQFDTATRDHAARQMADDFHDEAQYGEHDHRVSSGVHKKRAPKGLSGIAKQHGKAAKGQAMAPDATVQTSASAGKAAVASHEKFQAAAQKHGYDSPQARAAFKDHHDKHSGTPGVQFHPERTKQYLSGGKVKKSELSSLDLMKGAGLPQATHVSAGAITMPVAPAYVPSGAPTMPSGLRPSADPGKAPAVSSLDILKGASPIPDGTRLKGGRLIAPNSGLRTKE